MINWDKIEILEDEGITFWRLQKNPNKPEMNAPWSRDIKDLIETIKKLEDKKQEEEKQDASES